MIRKAVVVLALFGSLGAINAQEFFEASGQTAVGNFIAGGKIGSTAVRHNIIDSRAQIGKGFTVACVKNIMVISFANRLPGTASIALYDIRGRQVLVQHGSALGSIRLDTRGFATGVYHINVNVNGIRTSSSVMITR